MVWRLIVLSSMSAFYPWSAVFSLHFTLSLHFTSGLQSKVYSLRFTLTDIKSRSDHIKCRSDHIKSRLDHIKFRIDRIKSKLGYRNTKRILSGLAPHSSLFDDNIFLQSFHDALITPNGGIRFLFSLWNDCEVFICFTEPKSADSNGKMLTFQERENGCPFIW